jgi:hypothetical protein
MEPIFLFNIYYNKARVWAVIAHTKWEAIDKAYYQYATKFPEIERSKFRAKKSF